MQIIINLQEMAQYGAWNGGVFCENEAAATGRKLDHRVQIQLQEPRLICCKVKRSLHLQVLVSNAKPDKLCVGTASIKSVPQV